LKNIWMMITIPTFTAAQGQSHPLTTPSRRVPMKR